MPYGKSNKEIQGSKMSGFKMKGSPHKAGIIEGTSAFKQDKKNKGELEESIKATAVEKGNYGLKVKGGPASKSQILESYDVEKFNLLEDFNSGSISRKKYTEKKIVIDRKIKALR